MPYDELLAWIKYFEKRPVGWREDNRAYKLLQAQGVKAAPQLIFPTLEPIFKQDKPAEDGQVATRSLKNSALFMMLSQAKGGDKLDIFGEPK